MGQARPNPDNNAPGVDPNVVLEWAGGAGALYHDVYFGSDVNCVAEANHFSPYWIAPYATAHQIDESEKSK